jgi:osmoprotectant transport system permease protein
VNDQIAAAFAVLPNYLSQHIILSVAALTLGALVSFPLAILVARHPRWQGPVLGVASLVQTIPGLALLALFYPLLLALSSVTTRAFGLKIQALGFLPSLAALTLYAMLPILRNTVAGLAGVDPTILEAARGVGMTPRQRLLQVEIPLAAPVIMAGVRTSAVWTIGAATLATPVGQTSLGNYIFSGLQTENWIFVLFGCVASAVLALIVDLLLGLVENGAATRDRRKVVAGFGALAIGALAACIPSLATASGGYVIGAKNFSEQYILAELMARRMRETGASATLREGLGSAIAFRALASGDIDAYVDYTGTLWTNEMARKDTPPRDAMLAELTRWMRDQRGVIVLGALGFENAYALAMREERAEKLNIRSIDDLARRASELTIGADIEFLDRPEWRALRQVYDLRFKTQKSYNPTFMYRALADGDVDVISAFSSDGRIAADHLVVLEDPRHAAPNYDAVILISPKRRDDVKLIDALRPLIGAIDVDDMRAANYSVDRDENKRGPAQAADELARAIEARRAVPNK